MGHPGVDRTLDLIRERFYWPRMQEEVEHFIAHVCECLKRRRPQKPTRAPLVSIVMAHPFELVSMDFLHLETCKGGYEYILVLIDHYTRFAPAYATKDKSAKTVAQKVFNDFALRFGFPEKIHPNLGGEFENCLMALLKKCSGVRGTHTCYHPAGNGKTERFNKTILSMLRTLTDTKKADWKNSLEKMVHAYNCKRSEATGFSPYSLRFGNSPRLPIDIMFNLTPPEKQESYSEYVQNWRARMHQAYEIASRTAAKGASRGKLFHDKKVHGTDLQPGGRVLVRNLSQRGGPGKLRSYWEDRVHVVVQRRSDGSPVYEVMPEGGGKTRVLHRNLLLPCDSLPLDELEPGGPNRGRPQQTDSSNTRRTPVRKERRSHTKFIERTDSESENECDYVWTFTRRARREPVDNSRLNPEAQPFVPDPEMEPASLPQETAHLDVQEEAAPIPDTWAELYLLAQETNDAALETGDLDIQEGDALTLEGDDQPDSAQASDDEPDMQPVNTRPQRERRPPRMLTYEQLGNPSVVGAGMNNLQMNYGLPSVHTLWRPWTGMDVEVQG